jgi:hypothetical protein
MTLSFINYTDLSDAMNLAFNEAGLVPILVKAIEKLKDCTAQHVGFMVGINILYILLSFS